MLRVSVTTALLLIFSNAIAQSSEQQNKSADTPDVERIEVRGKKPKSFYFDQYRKIHRDFVKSFNSLVDNSEYEIICKMESQIGSRRKQRDCKPRFMKTMIAEETQRELSAGRDVNRASNSDMNPRLQRELIEEYKKFHQATAKVLEKNPELAQQYAEMNEALYKSRQD